MENGTYTIYDYIRISQTEHLNAIVLTKFEKMYLMFRMKLFSLFSPIMNYKIYQYLQNYLGDDFPTYNKQHTYAHNLPRNTSLFEYLNKDIEIFRERMSAVRDNTLEKYYITVQINNHHYNCVVYPPFNSLCVPFNEKELNLLSYLPSYISDEADHDAMKYFRSLFPNINGWNINLRMDTCNPKYYKVRYCDGDLDDIINHSYKIHFKCYNGDDVWIFCEHYKHSQLENDKQINYVITVNFQGYPKDDIKLLLEIPALNGEQACDIINNLRYGLSV